MKTPRRAKQRLILEELEGRVVPATLGYSTNWSGYAVATAANAVTAVSGSWNVPAIQPGKGTAYSAQWVGIDGYSSSTVEQIGTEADLINGVPKYYAWYEMYPAGYVTIPVTINPGDQVSASVAFSSNLFTLTLTDSTDTADKPYSVTKSIASPQLSSAEWIVEAPSSFSVLPLDNFGTVNFSNAQTTISGTIGAINNASWASEVNQIDMISSGRSHATLDTTSGLTDTTTNPATSSFSVTYGGSSTSTPTPPTPTPPPASPPPSRHHGGFPPGWSIGWRGPDQVFLPTLVFANSSGPGLPSGLQTYIPANVSPSAIRPAPGVEIGYGMRQSEIYLLGESTDQADDNSNGDAFVGPPAPAQQDTRVPPSLVDTSKATAMDDARWLAAVDAVFAQEATRWEDVLAFQVDRVDVPREQPSLAGGLVLAGAALTLGIRRAKQNIPWAVEEDEKRYRVIL